MKEVDTEQSLAYWASKAKKGDMVVYYDGFLMMDRQRYFMNGGFEDSQPEALKAAKLAWRMYNDGVLTLVQRKKEPFSYEYIAVKR